MEKPDEWWKTLHDKVTDTDVVLTDKELEMIERITGGHFPDAQFDPFEKSIDFFTGEKMIHPVSDRPEPKSRFVPSKWEAKKVRSSLYSPSLASPTLFCVVSRSSNSRELFAWDTLK